MTKKSTNVTNKTNLKKYGIIGLIAIILILGVTLLSRNAGAANNVTLTKVTPNSFQFGDNTGIKNSIHIVNKPLGPKGSDKYFKLEIEVEDGFLLGDKSGPNDEGITANPFKQQGDSGFSNKGKRCNPYIPYANPGDGRDYGCRGAYNFIMPDGSVNEGMFGEYIKHFNYMWLVQQERDPAPAKSAALNSESSKATLTYYNIGLYGKQPIGAIVTITPLEIGTLDTEHLPQGNTFRMILQASSSLYEGIYIGNGIARYDVKFFKGNDKTDFIEDENATTFFSMGSLNTGNWKPYGQGDSPSEFVAFPSNQLSRLKNTYVVDDNYTCKINKLVSDVDDVFLQNGGASVSPRGTAILERNDINVAGTIYKGVAAKDHYWVDYLGGECFERTIASFEFDGTDLSFIGSSGWHNFYTATLPSDTPNDTEKYVLNEAGQEVKIADVKPGSEVTFNVYHTVHETGVDTFATSGLYESYEIIDELPTGMTCEDVKLYQGNTDITDSGKRICSGTTASWKHNNPKTIPLNGQKYKMVVKAKVGNGAVGTLTNKTKVKINEYNPDPKDGCEADSNACVKIPVKVYYHQVKDDGFPQNTSTLPQDESLYAGDNYTPKPGLTTVDKDKICEFKGWYVGTGETSTWDSIYSASVLTGDLHLWGKWACRDRLIKIEKDENKTELGMGDSIVYTITSKVPEMKGNILTQYKYDKYVITDQLKHVLTVDGVDKIRVKHGNNDVTDNFIINVNASTNLITITAKTALLSQESFYGKTYTITIPAKVKDDADLTPYITSTIDNVANLAISDDQNIDSNTVKAKVKKYDITYNIIGSVAPPAQTISVPDVKTLNKTVTSGTTYNQEPKLTTTYTGQQCVFSGWYLDKDLSKSWKNGTPVTSNLDFYGKWDCNGVVNPLYKTANGEEISIDKEFNFTLTNTVPDIKDAALYYKKYEIVDKVESVFEVNKEKIKVTTGEEDVTANFTIKLDKDNILTLTATNIDKAEFYNKTYTFTIPVKAKPDSNLDVYKKDGKYVIPNKAELKIKLPAGSEECVEIGEEKICPVCDDTGCEIIIPGETEVEIPPVKINYEIVGDGPDPKYTDPTPGTDEILSGDPYRAKPGLNTKDPNKNCKFNGWFTDEGLKNQFKDGTQVTADMTLYGSWNCEEVVKVPPTAAYISRVMIGLALTVAAIAGAIYYFVLRRKKA